MSAVYTESRESVFKGPGLLSAIPRMVRGDATVLRSAKYELCTTQVGSTVTTVDWTRPSAVVNVIVDVPADKPVTVVVGQGAVQALTDATASLLAVCIYIGQIISHY